LFHAFKAVLLLQVEALIDPRLAVNDELFQQIALHQRQLQKLISQDWNTRFKVFKSKMEDLVQSSVMHDVPVALRATGTRRLGKYAC
jgi:hypothetical protein